MQFSGVRGGKLTASVSDYKRVFPACAGGETKAFNNSGQVVRRSEIATGAADAFLSAADGGPLQDLGTLGGLSSDASASRPCRGDGLVGPRGQQHAARLLI
jgi:probable HAF family extracellular repeat protein